MEYGGWYYSNLTLPPGTDDPIGAGMATMPPIPEGFVERVEYLERNAVRFGEHAREVDLDQDVWVFDSTAPARFWLSQTILEVGLHAWDASTAVARPSPLTPQISVEGVEQLCAMTFHRGRWWGEPWTAPSTPFGLIALDTGDEWFVHDRDDGRGAFEREGAERAATRASGTAEHLLLWLGGRMSASEITIVGDPDLAEAWRPDWAS
jgi:hypothetical protein